MSRAFQSGPCETTLAPNTRHQTFGPRAIRSAAFPKTQLAEMRRARAPDSPMTHPRPSPDTRVRAIAQSRLCHRHNRFPKYVRVVAPTRATGRTAHPIAHGRSSRENRFLSSAEPSAETNRAIASSLNESTGQACILCPKMQPVLPR